MAQRKKSPKASYTYVKDEKISPKTPKKGETSAAYRKTGGIKKVKTSNDTPTPRRDVVSRRNPKENIIARQSGEEAKRLGSAALAKRQEKELSSNVPLWDRPAIQTEGENPPLNRKEELERALDQGPFRKAELPKRKKDLKAVPASKSPALAPATVPSRGTTPGGAPAKPDRGSEIGGAMIVGPGSGAPEAITAPGKSTSMRTMRSAESIAETKSKAKRRLPGGLKTTQFNPMGTAERINPDRRAQREQRDLQRRIRTGKTTLPRRYGEAAVAAQKAAVVKAAKTAGVPVKNVKTGSFTGFMGSDEALAQGLSRSHFKGHGASEIMDYVKSTGSDIGSFYKHVTNTHAAETKKIKVGPPNDRRERSKSKITRWSPDAKAPGGYKPVSGYEGWVRVNTKDPKTKANIREMREYKAPAGSLSHIQMLHKKIQDFKDMRAMEASEKRDLNRSRKLSSITAPLVEAMDPNASTTEPTTEKPKKVNIVDPEKDRQALLPKGKKNQPPKGRSGKYVSKTATNTTGKVVTPAKPKFTEVKTPKRRSGI